MMPCLRRAPLRGISLVALGALFGPGAAPAAMAGSCASTAAPAAIHLSASASEQVQPDRFVAEFAAVQSGPSVRKLNAQLARQVSQAARQARNEGLTLQTLGISTTEQLPRDQRSASNPQWSVEADLQVRSSSPQALSQIASVLGKTLQIRGIHGEVSSTKRRQVQQALLDEAVARLRAKAWRVTHDFGESSWKLKDLSVQDAWGAPGPRPILFAALAQDSAPRLPVQPGRSTVQVHVDATVLMPQP